MPRITGCKDIHKLYSPKSRKSEFPAADFRFLLHVAANIARSFATVHQAHCVIGDVNHGSITVAANAWARIGAWWATIIVMALIFGPRARADELLFGIVGLPLMVIVPYTLGTFIVACAKALLPWPAPRWRRRRIHEEQLFRISR